MSTKDRLNALEQSVSCINVALALLRSPNANREGTSQNPQIDHLIERMGLLSATSADHHAQMEQSVLDLRSELDDLKNIVYRALARDSRQPTSRVRLPEPRSIYGAIT